MYLIDFAHVFPITKADAGTVLEKDNGYIYGLRNLLSCVANMKDRVVARSRLVQKLQEPLYNIRVSSGLLGTRAEGGSYSIPPSDRTGGSRRDSINTNSSLEADIPIAGESDQTAPGVVGSSLRMRPEKMGKSPKEGPH